MCDWKEPNFMLFDEFVYACSYGLLGEKLSPRAFRAQAP